MTTRYVMAAVMMLWASFPALAEADGKAIYGQTCIACHGADGKGAVPGVPDMTKADGPLKKSDDDLVRSVMNGYQTKGSPMAMPPKGANPKLTEESARAAVSYMRGAFRK